MDPDIGPSMLVAFTIMKKSPKPRIINNVIYSEIALFVFVLCLMTIGYAPTYVKFSNLAGVVMVAVWGVEFVLFKFRKARELGYPLKFHPLSGMFLLGGFMIIMLFFDSTGLQVVRTFVQVCILMFVVFNIIRLTGRTWPVDLAMFLGVIYMFSLVSDDIVAAVASEERYRLSMGDDSYGLNPNTYGALLNIQILFFLRFLFIVSPNYRRDLVHWGMLLIGLLASLVAAYQVLLVLGSRQNQLWLFINMLGIIFLGGSGRYWFIKIFAYTIVVSFLCGTAFWMVKDSAYFERFENLYYDMTRGTSQENSGHERMNLIKMGIDFWLTSPVVGHGNDSFRNISGQGIYSHNQFTELLVNYGLLGFCLFYSLHFFVLKRAYILWRLGKAYVKANATWLIIVIPSILVSNFFQPTYKEKTFGLVLSILAALAYQHTKKVTNDSEK